MRREWMRRQWDKKGADEKGMGGVGSGRRMEWEEQEVEGERSGKESWRKEWSESPRVPSFSPPALLTSESQSCQGSRGWTLSDREEK